MATEHKAGQKHHMITSFCPFFAMPGQVLKQLCYYLLTEALCSTLSNETATATSSKQSEFHCLNHVVKFALINME